MMLIMRLLAFLLFAAGSFAGDSLYFPPNQDAGWERMEPAKAGWDSAALQSVIASSARTRNTVTGRKVAARPANRGRDGGAYSPSLPGLRGAATASS